MENGEKSIIIIGAGFAGLAAGIYARLNGYSARIIEMHNQPGGLCTSWNRKGFTFDGCIHWLVGSSPRSGLHDIWEETGIIQERKFLDLEEYFRIEDHATGRTLVFHTDVDKLEKNLLEFSPADRLAIKEFTEGIRMCMHFDSPSKHDSLITRLGKQASTVSLFLTRGRKLRKWMHITASQFSGRFEDPLLREAFMQMWIPEFSMFFMLFTFAYLHNRNAGYPLGGSKPMSEAMEARFKDIGGEILYNSKVVKIITSADKATGVMLEDGTRLMADRIISAADGHSTLFEMLEDRYGDKSSRMPYSEWLTFPPLIYVSLGVNRRFDDVPKSVSGFTFRLKEPVAIAGKFRTWLPVHVYNHDPSLAPQGKTTVTVMLESDYDYWKALEGDRKKYLEKKDEIAGLVISLLGQKFPGISSDIEVTDVATPLTFERYTGNWKGSFEGWLITPANSGVIFKPMSQKIAGLNSFYMCGQWVEPGGGLPTSVMSAKRLLKTICREDGKKFRAE